MFDKAVVAAAMKKIPKKPDLVFRYGTAGFRGLGTTLRSTCLRIGALAALRGRCFVQEDGKTCKVMGLMLTASHNPEKDNGLKLVDPDGSMLAPEWEPLCTELCNSDDPAAVLEAIINKYNLDMSATPSLILGRDTRPTSPELHALLLEGIALMGGTVVDLGIVTTPVVHFCVWNHNQGLPATLDDYFQTLSSAFQTLHALESTQDSTMTPTIVDCSNGVGKFSGETFRNQLKTILPLELRNTKDTELNTLCGADHVQRTRTLPNGVDIKADNGRKCAAVDGDADRLVYFSIDQNNTNNPLVLIDGDKITCLFAAYVSSLLKTAELSTVLSLGIIQTAYANGASTDYIKNTLHINPIRTKTGVKHLHHAALTYDVGVYFEANGHGTIVFNSKAREVVSTTTVSDDDQSERAIAIRKLSALICLINPACGDAFSDLLACEIILTSKNWTLQDWAAIYDDYPSRLLQVSVPDRTKVTTTNAEQTVVTPEALQPIINNLVENKYGKTEEGKSMNSRSFVRPSGTEDCVRVYAESATQTAADALANDVKKAVTTYCV